MPRVVVVGSSNTDMTVRVPRLPAPGQTMLGSTFTTTPGGKGANQAVAARRAGAEVVFVTAVGNDDLGKQSLEVYKREGIDVSHVQVLDGETSGVALIFVGEDGENMIGVAPGANQQLTPDDVDDLPESLFRKDDVLLVSLEVPVKTAIRALRRGFAAEMHTILNPAPAPALSESDTRDLLSFATVVTPNGVEALALAGMPSGSPAETDWKFCAERLFAQGAVAAVITLGSRGCMVRTAGGIWSFDPPHVEPRRHRRRRRCVQRCVGRRAGRWKSELLDQPLHGQTLRRRWLSLSPVHNRLCRFATRSTDWRRARRYANSWANRFTRT